MAESFNEETKSSNSVAELMVEFAIDFFSKEEHRTQNAIEDILLPVILCYSQKLNGGKTLDTGIFKSRLTEEQLEFCKRVFERAKTIKINTIWFSCNTLFSYLQHFKEASELIITLYDDDQFDFPEDNLKFERIIISCIERNLYANPVESIIMKNNSIIKNFSLSGGYLNSDGLLHLIKNELNHLELVNIRVYSERDRDTLIKYILRLKNLETLKTVSTTKRIHVNAFNDFFEKWQEQIVSPLQSLRNLSFNLQQETPEQTYALQFFPNLVKIEIFYTV